MDRMARKSRGKYHEWLTKDGLLRIEAWASDGLTNEDIASNMGIARQTLNTWCNKYSDINDALKKGRTPVVRKLENALIERALGIEYEETEVTIDEVKGVKKQKVKKVKKYIAPDTTALIFLLKNYHPNKYRNYSDSTKRQIEADIKKLEAEATLAAKEAERLTENADRAIIINDTVTPARGEDDEFLV